MTAAALNMAQTAAAVGLSRERFRHVWQTWRRDLGFPAPFVIPQMGKSSRYAWRAEAVEEWRVARERALGGGVEDPAAANDRLAPKPLPTMARLQRERAAIAARMRQDA